jgi:hypothetical protein
MTKYNPYDILFVITANIPGMLRQKPVPLYNYDDLIFDIKKWLQECHEIVRSNLIGTKQKRIEDQRNKVHMHVFREGGAVLLRNEEAGKLDPIWLEPYKILDLDHRGSNAVIESTRRKKQKDRFNRLKTLQGSSVRSEKT